MERAVYLLILLAFIGASSADHHNEHHGNHHGMHYEGHHGHGVQRAPLDAEVFRVINKLGITQVHFGSMWLYWTNQVNSTNMVKSGDSSELVPASSYIMLMYIRGHCSGGTWGVYEDDILLSWNSGGSLLIHLIHPDGRHEEIELGDTQKNHEAQYTVVMPGGVYFAVELKTGDYVLNTDLASPSHDGSKYVKPTVDEMVGKFPQYESMIRRLANIRRGDTKLLSTPHGHSHQGHSHNAHQEHGQDTHQGHGQDSHHGHDHHDSHQHHHHD